MKCMFVDFKEWYDVFGNLCRYDSHFIIHETNFNSQQKTKHEAIVTKLL